MTELTCSFILVKYSHLIDVFRILYIRFHECQNVIPITTDFYSIYLRYSIKNAFF